MDFQSPAFLQQAFKQRIDHNTYGYTKVPKALNQALIKFYKDKKNIIPIKSKYIHSKGLLNNLGLSIKIALDFKVKPSIIQKTIPKIINK